jgi:hypothetical protein
MSDHITSLFAVVALIALVGLPFWFAFRKSARKLVDNWGDSHNPGSEVTGAYGNFSPDNLPNLGQDINHNS